MKQVTAHSEHAQWFAGGGVAAWCGRRSANVWCSRVGGTARNFWSGLPTPRPGLNRPTLPYLTLPYPTLEEELELFWSWMKPYIARRTHR